jgi:hypothetical protein
VIDSESKIEFGKNKLSVFSIAMQKIAQIVEIWTRVDYIKIFQNCSDFSKILVLKPSKSFDYSHIIQIFHNSLILLTHTPTLIFILTLTQTAVGRFLKASNLSRLLEIIFLNNLN